MPEIGTANITFGVSDQTYGYFSSFTVEKSAEVAEQTNGSGDVKRVQYFGDKFTVSGTYVVIAASGEGDPYDDVGTGGGVTFTDGPGTTYISRATVNKTSDGFKSVDFEGTFFPDLG